MKSLLVANRGEVAIRVLRAAAEMGLRTVAVHSEDDTLALHTRMADEVRPLRGKGPAAYLDSEQLVETARAAGCDAIHPGYGFLSESGAFARLCIEAGLTFVGPPPEVLDLFGDKTAARALAMRCQVPVPPGSEGPVSLSEARAFLESSGSGAAVLLKAVAGGGGRGMRVVAGGDDLEAAYERCRSEALHAYGRGDLYVERLLDTARHVEVQVLGDRSGAISHLWERECSLQRRHQKLVEFAPAPSLPGDVRDRLLAAAVRMAEEAAYAGIGTFEFLVTTDEQGRYEFSFLEANPRLQVEHTVTEEVTGVDLVKTQLALADGATLVQLKLDRAGIPATRGQAIQLRVNAETLSADGTLHPSAGVLTAFAPPSGPGVRVDSAAYPGYRINPRFDSLLAKVIVHNPAGGLEAMLARAYWTLTEFQIEGVETNVPLLLNLLQHEDLAGGRVHTRFVDQHLAELTATGRHPKRFFDTPAAGGRPEVGGRVDPMDPLAILEYGKTSPMEARVSAGYAERSGLVALRAPLSGVVVGVEVTVGDQVAARAPLLILEAMKMEHEVYAETAGVVSRLEVGKGDLVAQGQVLLWLEEAATGIPTAVPEAAEGADLDAVRPDRAEMIDRQARTLDAARPEAVEQRRRTGQRTARENVADLCDAGSFVEYAPLVVAAQRLRRPLEELIDRTPADGIVAGIGCVNGDLFGADLSSCAVLAYDYTVLAGTQGGFGHEKMDRIFELTARLRLPLVVFAEGGGGRAGDTDGRGVSGFKVLAFNLHAKLSGLVPLVGIVSGRSFAGNAVLLGCSDVIIATANTNLGMGGPAMIEGGGLGVYRPEEIGPMDVQVPNGVVDIAVADEAEAVEVAKRYLGYFQGPMKEWEAADQRPLRQVVPENRLRVYDVRQVVETIADAGSVLELRREFGVGIVTALIRVEGRSLGVIANNPSHLGGAIDSPGADKASRFMQLCDAFDLPILFLCDTPGIMVGPEVEKTALVRHSARMFVTGANLSVPFFTIVLRKCYGLGALTMAGGSSKAPVFAVAWPTGEFGGMGLEGQVKLGYRKELAAIEDPAERLGAYRKMVAERYEHGKALNAAAFFEVDDVIDPADSRRWLASGLAATPAPPRRGAKKRPHIDTW